MSWVIIYVISFTFHKRILNDYLLPILIKFSLKKNTFAIEGNASSVPAVLLLLEFFYLNTFCSIQLLGSNNVHSLYNSVWDLNPENFVGSGSIITSRSLGKPQKNGIYLVARPLRPNTDFDKKNPKICWTKRAIFRRHFVSRYPKISPSK